MNAAYAASKAVLPLAFCALGGSVSGGFEVGERFRDCPECPEMVVVPTGSFQMGSPESEEGRHDDEGPQHAVTIARPFAVGVYEVTVADWLACVAAGGCGEGVARRSANEDLSRVAMRHVSWSEAQTYVDWLSASTGERYRLPSEAEWEYCARAGTMTPFHTGRTISMAQANFNGTTTLGAARDGGYHRRRTAPVGSFAANAWGVHDMHGNVKEWVQDCYHENYAGAPTDGSAWERPNCSTRVWRGGGWQSESSEVRSARRARSDRTDRSMGFRVVRTVDGTTARPNPASAGLVEEGPGQSGESTPAGRQIKERDRTDAALLALRILHRKSNDLLPDDDRLAELSSELAGVLSRLRKTYPEFARFRVRPWPLGVFNVGLDYEFALALQDALRPHRTMAKREQGAIVRTGNKAFDELNAKMALRHIHLWADGLATLQLHEHANLRAVADAYSALDVVEWAEPDARLGETPYIDATRAEDGWMIQIFNGWGDCVAGCINREVFYFLATGETVRRLNRAGSPDSPTLGTW